jgi:transposase
LNLARLIFVCAVYGAFGTYAVTALMAGLFVIAGLRVFAFPRAARGFERRLTPVRRQHHVAGEKAFVNYLGKWIGIVDPSTREIREAEIFVGVLGASNLTYAEAT